MTDFVPTLDDDSELLNGKEESESEDEFADVGDKRRARVSSRADKTAHFNSQFEFSVGEGEFSNRTWTLGTEIRRAAKGQLSVGILDAKIANALSKRGRKLQLDNEIVCEDTASLDVNTNTGNEQSEVPARDDSTDTTDSDQEQDSEAEAEKAVFFEAPPPQVEIGFTDMNLSRPVLKAITSLGFIQPTPIQAAGIPVILAGKDICACAATGTGKTAAFVVPILERLLYRPPQVSTTRVLILVPTRELAIQVHSVALALAKNVKVDICLATGGMEIKAQEAALRKGPDIVVATPGRLIDHLHNAPSFDLQSIEILVLDEADRMLEENFEDQLNEIIKLSSRGRQTMLFSATMTDEVKELVRLSLNQPVRLFVDSNMDVAANLQQEFVRIRPNREQDREAIIIALCSRSFQDHCLLFLPTKRQAHRVRIILGLVGIKASELHGSLTQLQRLEALEKFKEKSVDVLVATDLAARGLDIVDVKTVINFSMPWSFKQYIHRVGRTARAGRKGRSITLVGEQDRQMLKEVVKHARTPVKSRVIPPDVIAKIKDKLSRLEKDIKDILKQEDEEKQMRRAEMEMNKARNMIEHQREIFSRPARTWFETKKGRGTKRPLPTDTNVPTSEAKKGKSGKRKSKKERLAEEDSKTRRTLNKTLKFDARSAKRSQKKKKLVVIPENKNHHGKGQPNKKTRPVRTFDRELTDTSKKALKSFREEPSAFTGKGGTSGFKSRMRYKRK
ncbi:probable ATP-dependent RNA helicase DDX27 [Corticium candelabrum]|uniref:probable ATP-dependent RNA helicase DDX27 n=1 Tax=Corticium candelabrum TaxID=121492 RepID=UPI002E255198|nr:probable ATP-dependent RNA helicase DDX27 [Corticium candelabrum]